MVPVNDDEVPVPSAVPAQGADIADSPIEAPDGGAEPETSTSGAPSEAEPASRATYRNSSGLDLWLNRAIWGVVAALVLLGAYFGYSYYQAQQQARLANPALQLVDQVQKLVAKNPNDPSLRARLGEAYAAAGDNNSAKVELLAAVKMKNDFAGAYQDLAEIALIEKDNANAEIYLKRLLDITSTGQYENLNDRREFALFSLGELMLEQKRWTEAIGYLNAALKIRKDASDTYLRLAQAYHGSGDDASALEQVAIALKFDPKYAEAYYFEGTLYKAKGDLVDAAWDFRAAIDYAPDQPDPKTALAALGTFDKWMTAAQQAFSSGDLSAAVDAVSIARSINPTSYEAAMLHGRILDQQGKYSDAVAAYTQALKNKPGDKAATAALAAAQAAAKKGAK